MTAGHLLAASQAESTGASVTFWILAVISVAAGLGMILAQAAAAAVDQARADADAAAGETATAQEQAQRDDLTAEEAWTELEQAQEAVAVGEQDQRTIHERPRDRDPLLLTT